MLNVSCVSVPRIRHATEDALSESQHVSHPVLVFAGQGSQSCLYRVLLHHPQLADGELGPLATRVWVERLLGRLLIQGSLEDVEVLAPV